MCNDNGVELSVVVDIETYGDQAEIAGIEFFCKSME